MDKGVPPNPSQRVRRLRCAGLCAGALASRSRADFTASGVLRVGDGYRHPRDSRAACSASNLCPHVARAQRAGVRRIVVVDRGASGEASGPILVDLRSHQRAPGFFTSSLRRRARTQFACRSTRSARHTCCGGCLRAVVVLTYAIFTALTVRPGQAGSCDGINGGWLTAVVATQSLVVLGTVIAPQLGDDAELVALLLASLCLPAACSTCG